MTREEKVMKKGNSIVSLSGRRAALKATALGVAALGFPAIVRAQADTIKLGHLTPRTGLLGRKVELIAEDSVNPQIAVTKAQKLAEREHVLALIGEINSASALAIAEQALRYKLPFFNTGANSDALRGKNCNRYMFHVEGCNTMYTKTIGTWQKAENKIRGAKWYMLTADYAFGHDLF